MAVSIDHAIHTATTVTPFEAMFNRPPLRRMGAPLPTISNSEVDREALGTLITIASRASQKRSRDMANLGVKPRWAEVGDLVWVKAEKTVPNTCSKLNLKWYGPYKVTQVLQEGLAYILKDPFSEKLVQRAAEKVRPFYSGEGWCGRREEVVEVDEGEGEDEPLPPRCRKPPRRLIEEV